MEKRDPTSTESLSREELEEQERIELALQKEQRKDAPISTGCFVRATIASVLLTLIVFGLGGFAYQSRIAALVTKRDAVLAEIRASGDPITAEEMAAFAATPKETNELTKRFLKILDDRQQNGRYAPGDELLPIVGQGALPQRGEPWDLQPAVEQYLSKRPWVDDAEALAQLDGEIRVPREYGKDSTKFFENVNLVREMIRELKLRFHVRMRQGDRAGALRALRAIFRLPRVYDREPDVSSQLIRGAFYGIGVASACDFLDDGKATPDEIAAVRTMIDGDFRAALVPALKGERASGFITLNSLEARQIAELFGNKTGMPSLPVTGKITEVRPGDTAKLLESLGELIEIAENNDLPETMRQFQLKEDQLKQMVKDEQLSLPWNRHVLVANLLPQYFACGKLLTRAAATQSALKAALDVEQKMLALGPEARTKEAEIVAIEEFLPTDPFTGQPMKYIVGDLDYRIYSVGDNGIDDTASGKDFYLDFGVEIERTLAKPGK